MDILQIAIREAGGISKLARELGVSPSVVSNWVMRKKLSLPWILALELKYAKAIRAARKADTQAA